MKNFKNKNLILFFLVAIIFLFSFSLSQNALAFTFTAGSGVQFYPTNDNNSYDSSGSYSNTNNYNNSNNSNANNYNDLSNTNNIPTITSLSSDSAITGTGSKLITIYGYNFNPGSIARWNNSDRNTTFVNKNKLIIHLNEYDTKRLGDNSISVYNHIINGGISNIKIFTLKEKTIPVATNNVSAKNTSKTNSFPSIFSTTKNKKTESATSATEKNDKNNLGASAILGVNDFLPTTFLQWLLLIILILLIVIAWRRIVQSTEKHQNRPLKHA